MERQLRVLIIVENLSGPFRPPCLVGGDDAPRRRPLCLRDLPQGTRLSAVARDHRWHIDLSPSAAARGAGRRSLFHRVSGSIALGIRAFAQSLASSRLRRDPRLQSTRSHFPDRSFLQIFAGKSFVFDHHDANPEFYEAKFGRRGFLWKLLRLAEKLTFKAADISIATNEFYRRIAIERGGMRPERVFVVRSGPNLDRVKKLPPDPAWRKGRRFLVGYVGVISRSEGLDLLLSSISHVVDSRGRQRHSLRRGRQRPGIGGNHTGGRDNECGGLRHFHRQN